MQLDGEETGHVENAGTYHRDIAAYVEESCAELRRLAKDPRLRTVSYLLDMARVEAKAIAQMERSARRPSGSH